MTGRNLVLSLFPGVGLLDRAFEESGFCVVRGPDLIFGGDVRRFVPPRGVFDGVIGGPPCQRFSSAGRLDGSTTDDLIPEFVRIVEQARPRFVVMENVRGAADHPALPSSWIPTTLRDFDCGGETSRERTFWTWPFALLGVSRAAGRPARSVMATTYKRGRASGGYVADKGYLPGDLPVAEYARLQGAPDLGATLQQLGAGRKFAVHVLGNGVPLAMGRFVAKAAARAMLDRAA